MAKVILNKDYGGFGVSALAHKMYAKKKFGRELFIYSGDDITEDRKVHYTKLSVDDFKEKHSFFYFYSFTDLGQEIIIDLAHEDNIETLNITSDYREDPLLIEIVEELGEKANDSFSTLKVVEIPDELANGNYIIDDYDGIETLHAKVDIY